MKPALQTFLVICLLASWAELRRRSAIKLRFAGLAAQTTVELGLCFGNEVPHRCVEGRYVNRLGSCKEIENAFNNMIYKPYRGSRQTMN